jgi:predicted DNA-binding protein YlxM (UPF0122 family)
MTTLFLELLIDLGNTAMADEAHGEGVDTIDRAQDHIEYYDERLKLVMDEQKRIKAELKKQFPEIEMDTP